MKTTMMKTSLWLLLFGLAVTSATAGPGSCVGRCGEVFTRGQQCTCDFSCVQHNECCPDFEASCINAQSCQVRCGEPFRRGRPCDCDDQCVRHNTCCRDYHPHCDVGVSVSGPHAGTFQPLRASATVSSRGKSEQSWIGSNSESEEWHKVSSSSSHGGALPSPNVQGKAPLSPSGPNRPRVLSPVDGAPFGSSQAGSRPRPSSLQDVAQALGLSVVDIGSEGPGAGSFADVDLCSDSPINGLTALSNGTILIFKGEFFWSVDPVSRIVGHPQSITDTLGVSSPIDSVFTRCNCHRNTYIIKGDQYWRLDGNMVVEHGFPRPLASEFPGVTGTISAALAAPATRARSETVYFFKSGDMMQSFTFPPGGTLSCSTGPSSLLKRHLSRQAVYPIGEINIKVSLKGFPTPVTSALSMANPLRSDTYYLYVFSGPFFSRVHIVGDLPALAKPDTSAGHAPFPFLSPIARETSSANLATLSANPTHPVNSIRYWLRCP